MAERTFSYLWLLLHLCVAQTRTEHGSPGLRCKSDYSDLHWSLSAFSGKGRFPSSTELLRNLQHGVGTLRKRQLPDNHPVRVRTSELQSFSEQVWRWATLFM